MDVQKPAPKQLLPDECYVRIGSRAANAGEPKIASIEKVKRYPAEKLESLQYSLDGQRWFTAKRLDPNIEYEAFISCSSDDYKKAENLRARMQSENLRAFVATKEIFYANDFETVLRQSVERALVFVALLSQNVNKRPENVKFEIDWARKCRKPIIPINIDNSEIHPDIAWGLHKVHQIAAHDKPWSDVIEIALTAIFKALGEQNYVPDRGNRFWERLRKVWQAFLTWTRRLALVIGVLIVCACLGLGWMFRDKLFPPTVPMAAVVITPNKQPRAFWRDDAIHAESFGPTTNKPTEIVDVVSKLISSDRECMSFDKLYIGRGPRAVLSLFKGDVKTPDLTKSDFQWFLYSGPEDTDPGGEALQAQALVLTDLGSALEPAFGKLNKPSQATSWLIVHIDRTRALFVWFRSASSGKNYMSWPKNQTFQQANFERLSDDVKNQDDKAPGILSNDIVVFCGEVPALAFRSKVGEDRLAIRGINAHYDRKDPLDHLPWVIMCQGESEWGKAFNTNLTYESLQRDSCLLLPSLHDVQKLEDLEAISKGIKQIPAIISALEIGPRSRSVYVLPFVF